MKTVSWKQTSNEYVQTKFNKKKIIYSYITHSDVHKIPNFIDDEHTTVLQSCLFAQNA